MYEVFSNAKRILIGAALQHVDQKEGKQRLLPDNIAVIRRRVFDYLVSGETQPLKLEESPEELWEHFSSWFNPIEAAGGVVISKQGWLFIRKNGKWDLPKGKVEEGETTASAAVREVAEETGAEGIEIIKPLRDTWHIYTTTDGNYMLKRTYWFLMKAGVESPLIPDQHENIEKVLWVTFSDVPEVAKTIWPNLKSLIFEAMEEAIQV